MEHFLSAEETIQRLNIRPFQLLGLMKEGKLQAYASDTGDMVIDADSLERLPPRTLEECKILIWSQMRAEEERISASLDYVEDLSPWFRVSNEERWEKAKMIYYLLQQTPLLKDTIQDLGRSEEGELLFVDYHAWVLPKSIQETYDKLNSSIEDYKRWKWQITQDAKTRRYYAEKNHDQLAEDYYYAQPWTITAPPNCVAISFGDKRSLDTIMTFLFKEVEVMTLDEILPVPENAHITLSKRNEGFDDDFLKASVEATENSAQSKSYDEKPFTDTSTQNGERQKSKLTVQERGRKGGAHNKKNMVLVRAIKAAFKKRPSLREKPASSVLTHLRHNPVNTPRGNLYFEDDVLMTKFKGKITSVAEYTFKRYVYEIKRELGTKPTDK